MHRELCLSSQSQEKALPVVTYALADKRDCYYSYQQHDGKVKVI